MDLTKKIGWRLREVRTGQGLSLAELSVRTGDVLSKSRVVPAVVRESSLSAHYDVAGVS